MVYEFWMPIESDTFLNPFFNEKIPVRITLNKNDLKAMAFQ